MFENESVDELLEGGLKIIQDSSLYRFTSDAVLLSRFARAKSHDVVADFCSGSGIVGLHFYALHPQIDSVVLFEMQPELAAMSERSIRLNDLKNFRVECCRVQDIGREYDEKFSLVLCNPPYERGGFEKEDPKKAVCRKEITITLPEIVQAAYKKLKYGGRFALINRADRLAEVIYLLKYSALEPKRLQFVSGKEGGKPYLLMIEAVKGGKPGLELVRTAVNSPARTEE